MKTLFTMVLLLALTVSVSVSAHASPTLSASDVVGVWRLVDSSNPTPGHAAVPYCNGVHGYIVYTGEGYVTVSLNCGPRLNPSEPADISGRKFFYAGTYTIKGSTIFHQMENASDVQLIGSSFSREAEINGKLLSLTGENQGEHFTATWEKVDAAP